MKQDKFSRANLILYACGLIPVIWLAFLTAPFIGEGLPSFVKNVGEAFSNPMHIELCKDSAKKTVLAFLLAYGLGLCIYFSSDRNYRRCEEHGSAKWGKPNAVNRKYANPSKTANKLLTQNVGIGLDGRKHRRNLNVLTCGGSGSGKTRFFAKPNVMNANTSYVVLDPNGKLLLLLCALRKSTDSDNKRRADKAQRKR